MPSIAEDEEECAQIAGVWKDGVWKKLGEVCGSNVVEVVTTTTTTVLSLLATAR